MTKGHELIGAFNVSDKSEVDIIKQKSAELIDYINNLEGCPRRKAIAFTHLETAQMFAVKSLFYK